MLPPDHLDGAARLEWYRAARAREEERRRVEAIAAKKERGEALTAAEEAAYAYSPFGTAASCRCR